MDRLGPRGSDNWIVTYILAILSLICEVASDRVSHMQKVLSTAYPMRRICDTETPPGKLLLHFPPGDLNITQGKP